MTATLVIRLWDNAWAEFIPYADPDNKRSCHHSLHRLRHSWATMALAGNVHVRIVQERLGHSSARITLNIYSHVGPTLHREAAEAIATGLFAG